ncbi:MAG TPA: hypothetical protein VIL74_05195 [Pyrinomonadaceae bacterium]|jgi:Na+/melibiose symporter-like transporter
MNIENSEIPLGEPHEARAAFKLRSCGQCDFHGATADNVCPKCDEPTLFDPETVGALGLVMGVLGALLCVFMVAVIVKARESFAQAETYRAASKAAAKIKQQAPADPSILYLLLGLVLMVGVAIMVNGFMDYYYQRRNLKMTIFVILTIKGVFALFGIAMALTGGA